MIATGLQIPTPQPMSVGGIMGIKSASAVLAQEQADYASRAEAVNNQPAIVGLAGHIRRCWSQAREAKQNVELKMMDALRAKRGEYHPDKLAQLREQGSSEIYMMLFATKARQLKALLGDILLAEGSEKPWSISPTPVANLPQELTTQILQGVYQLVVQAETSGVPMDMEQIRVMLRDAKDRALASIQQEATVRAKRAEDKLEDILLEGDFLEAMDEFLDDLAVFPTAFIKGPVIENCSKLEWVEGIDGRSFPTVKKSPARKWKRVSALDIYPAPWSKNVQDAYLIERHRLSDTALADLIGVEGYSEDAIRQVLDLHGRNGLQEWLLIDNERARVESQSNVNPLLQSRLIDALQYWGSATGQDLLDWGMTEEQVPDKAKVYEIEAWLIGSYVIKAVINPDPLYRRPYYGDSFERQPGGFWGNSLYETMRDCEDMCNASARALANNMGLSSGPQVWVMADRLADGEEITSMYPWKLWQVTSDPSGSTAQPMGFFQPQSNASELMGVFERYSQLADEVTGIPRYMTGDGVAGGAGRTASGMSMMVGNAGKTTKKTIGSIDMRITGPILNALYDHVMQYDDDPDIKGDLQIQARGAASLMAKDAAQVRRNQFLQFTANPFDMQIMGLEGRAAVLRETAKTLDMNPDDVVPPPSVIRFRMAQMQQQQLMMAAQQGQGENGPPGGSGNKPSSKPGEKRLMNDAPATDNFGDA